MLISIIPPDLDYAAPTTVPFMPATQRNRLCELWRKAVRCAAGVNKQDDVSPLLGHLNRPLKPFTSHGEKSFSNMYRGPLLWNHLPQDLRTTDSLPLFKMTFLDLLSPQLLSLALGNVNDFV